MDARDRWAARADRSTVQRGSAAAYRACKYWSPARIDTARALAGLPALRGSGLRTFLAGKPAAAAQSLSTKSASIPCTEAGGLGIQRSAGIPAITAKAPPQVFATSCGEEVTGDISSCWLSGTAVRTNLYLPTLERLSDATPEP